MQFSTSEFEILYNQCFPQAMKLALYILHEENEARDVVHEVFLRLWESKIKIENPPAFIIRAVRNISLNRISQINLREKIKKRLFLELPPEEFEIQEEGEDVLLAIKKLLTSREQQILELIYSEEKTYKETAAQLNISVSAVNKYIVAALKKLRVHFKSRNL